MRKIFGVLLLIIFGFAVNTNSVYADDLNALCTKNGPCVVTPPNTPLFEEYNWLPGDSATRSLTVKNLDPKESCNLTLNVEDTGEYVQGFPHFVDTSISSSSTTYFDDTFESLFGSSISLGTVPSGSTVVYSWTAMLDSSTPNAYQDNSLYFDFHINLSCGSPGATLSSAGPPVCTDSAPTSAPFLSVNSVANNTAGLSWTSVSPITHYMIRYGINSGNYVYGAPNVGIVNSYTVSSLSSGATFFFQVAGVNGCAPGPWSNEVSTRPSGVVLPIQPSPGFSEVTLGVSDDLSGSSNNNSAGEVLGANGDVCTANPYPWWIPLVLQFIFVCFYYLIMKDSDSGVWWLFPLALSVISQIIHEILGCSCATGDYCKYYWVLNLLILVITGATYRYLKPKKKGPGRPKGSINKKK